jgi:hypothetical protein
MLIARNSHRETDTKMKELILYVVGSCAKNETVGSLGAIGLNKILFYSDFAAYLKLGKSITGQDYFALEMGPAPKRLIPIRKQLERERALKVVIAEISATHRQQIFIPLREAKFSIFTAEEISIVDQMILRFVFKTAKSISEESHKFIGWDAAELKEVIPYSSAHLDASHILGQKDMISKSEIQHMRKLAPEAKRLREEYA